MEGVKCGFVVETFSGVEGGGFIGQKRGIINVYAGAPRSQITAL
jgi:hypothetical protein